MFNESEERVEGVHGAGCRESVCGVCEDGREVVLSALNLSSMTMKRAH